MVENEEVAVARAALVVTEAVVEPLSEAVSDASARPLARAVTTVMSVVDAVLVVAASEEESEVVVAHVLTDTDSASIVVCAVSRLVSTF